MSERFDVSRAAAARRYVALHEATLAVVFSRDGRVLYIDKDEAFPRTAAWKGDATGHLLPQRGREPLSGMDQVEAEDWIAGCFPGEVFAQTLHQAHGHAITLLRAEPGDRGDG